MARTASEYAGDINLSLLAQEGLGTEFQRGIIDIGINRARSKLDSFRGRREGILGHRGFDASGVDDIMLPSMGFSEFTADVLSAENQAFAENEQIRQGYQSMLFNHLSNQDQLRAQREANERDWMDYVGFGGSLLSLAAGA